MPTFEIISPDGKTYDVTGPEGSTKEQALERVKSQHAATPAEAPSSLVDAAKEGGKGLLRGFTGLVGGIADDFMEPIREIVSAGKHLSGKPNQLPADPGYGSQISHAMGTEPDPKTTPGAFAGTIGEFVGNPASYLGPGGPLSKIGTAALSGLGSEGAGQLTKGTGLEPAARLGGAVVAGQAPRTIAKVAGGPRVTPERAAIRDALRAEGVEPTAGEISGNRAVRTAESQLGNAPGSGQAYSRAKEQELRQYTRAVVKRAGVDSDNALPETINEIRDKAASRLESAAADMKIRMDPKMGNEFAELRSDLQREGATPDQINRINQQLENIQNGFVTTVKKTAGGANDTIMDGKTYQGLTRHGTPLQRAIDDPDPTVSYYSLRIRSALDDAMERTAQGRGTRAGVGLRQAMDDLREARRHWYNMIVISKAVSGPGEAAPAGLVTPQKLRQILTSSQDKKLQYAAGRGDLAELARSGESMMQPIGSSQTSERSLITAIPAAIGASVGQAIQGEPISGALAGVMAPGGAGRVLMSPLMQTYLKGELPGQRAAQNYFDSQAGAGATALRSALSTPSSELYQPSK